MQRTLAIIKPDAVAAALIGDIIKTIEDAGIRIVALRMEHLTGRKAEGFYYVHRDKSFFASLVAFMSSGPCVLLVLEGEDVIARWRALMGATDPAKAAPGTIRKRFGSGIERNAVHGSDAPDTALFELNYFFTL